MLGLGVPTARSEFSVSADGKRSYFAEAKAYYVFDENGDPVDRIPTSGVTRTLAFLQDGRFISAQSHAGGHVALLGRDGAELKSLVARGASPQNLHTDTSWSTPSGLAVDSTQHLMFVLDTTVAPKGTPDPDWSRVAVFDTSGKYLRSIAAYDGSKTSTTEEWRTRYDDIEVDSKRSVLYVTAGAARQLWAFNYDGTLVGKAPGVAGIAVLPNGNVAVADPDHRHVRVYDPALKVVKTLSAAGVLDLEADTNGRLYASVADPTILYLRWPSSFSEPDVVHPPFQRITVGIPFDTAKPGVPFSLPVTIAGRPAVPGNEWHVFARPSDGTDLSWKELPSSYGPGALTVEAPADLRGLYDIAVRYGKGAITRNDGVRDLHVEKTISFGAGPENGSISVRSLVNRAGFRCGEAIPIRIDVRSALQRSVAQLWLERDGKVLGSTSLTMATHYWQIPQGITRRLLPGHYQVRGVIDSLPTNPYEFDLAEAEPDSPVQRILYHEFDQNPATFPQPGLLSVAERLAFIRDYTDAVAGLAFTRETDRGAGKLLSPKPVGTWRHDSTAEPTTHDSVPLGGLWEPEFYLDRATARGIHLDTQVLAHCSGVRLAADWFPSLDATMQRLSQWFGRYPAFYGFNYNDEIFFPNAPFSDSSTADKAWLNAAVSRLAGRPKADAFRLGLTHMYGELDRAVEEVRGDLSRTATPMWQYPAVEGSYAPTIYANMTESYSHYLSEAYGWPWYPAHSVDMLRRPGLPLMGVFDDAYSMGDGESYLKDALQVLGRGAQGVGVEHERPIKEARGANALRVMNTLAEMYGPVFAEAEPDNDAAVLYSYSQDVTEKRDWLGTPHWQRVLALHGAALMAGLPTSIVYEEDIAAGALLDHGKPKTKFLFLVGQTAELPEPVKTAVNAFRAAGGELVIDADSRELTGATRFPHTLLGVARAGRSGHDSDALFPDTQPEYETLAATLRTQFGTDRRYPVDSNDPWVSKNRFNAGAIHYVLVTSETSPFPWPPPSVWSLGARFNKSYLPKLVTLTVPASGVTYDAFERKIVNATSSGKSRLVNVDLKTFPGKLYALAPRALRAPQLSARVTRDELTYTVNVGMPARVPLRITLSDGGGAASTLYRGTNLRGELEHTVGRPVGPGPWKLQVSELLGGATSTLVVPGSELDEPLALALPTVETEREPQIRALLKQASGSLHVLGVDAVQSDLRASLLRALKDSGVRTTLDPSPTPSATATTYLVFGISSKDLTEPLKSANQLGLFGRNLSDVYPGSGRGFISATFAARAYAENSVAIVGGDQAGLNAAAARFITLLSEPSVTARSKNLNQTAAIALNGPGTGNLDLPPLRELVGARLSGIRANNGRLAVAANGYLHNLARINDEGDHGRVVAVTRIGESPTTTSLFLSNDGTAYGLAARTIQRFGEAFSLSSSDSLTQDAFTSFGDAPTYQHIFSASGDARTVLAPGPYGVVAWQRSGNSWREQWSLDYWKKFDEMDWPVTPTAARVPSFDTLIPKNADIALISFADLTNGWREHETRPTAELLARSIKDGTPRWQFTEPPSGLPESAQVYSNSNASLVVFRTQIGGTGALRFYALNRGRLLGSWGSSDTPFALEIAERGERVAVAYGGGSRLLELRLADGTVVYDKTWHAQPIAIALAEDGMSVFVSDDAGLLSKLDPRGNILWQVPLGCSAELAWDGARLYAAGWNGRLHAFTSDGQEHWKLDLTESIANMIPGTATSVAPPRMHEPERPSSASSSLPRGVNLLRSGGATLTVGGTRGWMSRGTVEIEAGALTNGNVEDSATPWLSNDELFWDGTALRKVWAQMDLKQPTDVHSLTVYENSKFRDSWPTESLIQAWDEANQRWRTVKHGVFLNGARATYLLDLKRVSKLRYVLWGNYFRNFHTSEIELR